MESKRRLICRFAVGLLGALWAPVMVGQQASPSAENAVSVVTDWSHQSLIYSAPPETVLSEQFRDEPRYWQQWLRRNGRSPASASKVPDSSASPGRQPIRKFKRDWAVSLGPGATVGAGHYPAKFSFDINSAHCGGDAQPDFVAFNTSVAGSATQASIVAYDNLYSGCTGTVPMTYWAYNTGGTAITSAVLSLNGTQLAFVQSSAGHAQLVLLKWQASTTSSSTNPGPITAVTASQYPTCSAPCMTTLPFSGGANDTNSSPFYDYSGDVMYVGDDSGILHKFTPVFVLGTPAEVITGGWPSTLASGRKLSSPVYDHPSQKVFVGSSFTGGSGSQLFAVAGATGVAAGTSSSLGQGAGIVASPIVDSSAGKVFVFVGNDGTTNCSGPCSAVYQFATGFTSGTGTKAPVGMGGSLPLYNGAFDNAYIASANSTGSLYVCGEGQFQAEPTIVRVPVFAGSMSTLAAFGPAISTSNTPCSPLAAVFNPAGTGTDRVFASVAAGSDAAACSGGSCITNLTIGAWQPSTSYTVGQRILDPANFWQVVSTAGTTGSSSAPSWVDTCNTLTADGTVTWTNAGFLTPVTPQGWTPSTFYSVGSRILDSNGNFECNLQTGIATGTNPPTWSTTIGALTTEVTGLKWRNGGPPASHSLSQPGGTSGIIMDNVVGSGVLAGASEVYFSTIGTGGCGAGNGCAVQATQAALN